MKEAILGSETSDLTIAARRNIPEDVILHGPILFPCHLNIPFELYMCTIFQRFKQIIYFHKIWFKFHCKKSHFYKTHSRQFFYLTNFSREYEHAPWRCPLPPSLSACLSASSLYTFQSADWLSVHVAWILKMTSSGMLRRVALVSTNVLEEISTSIIRVIRIGELGTALAVTSNQRTQLLVTATLFLVYRFLSSW
jgi:hypothetical protein